MECLFVRAARVSERALPPLTRAARTEEYSWISCYGSAKTLGFNFSAGRISLKLTST
jgi:hypothetical protein